MSVHVGVEPVADGVGQQAPGRGVLILGERQRRDADADARYANTGAAAAAALVGHGFAVASSLQVSDAPTAFAACAAIGWERGANWVVDAAAGPSTGPSDNRASGRGRSHFRVRGALDAVWAVERSSSVCPGLPDLLRRLAPTAPRRLVLTNGVFDVLHVGHLRALCHARACGDLLVVALNSDASARRIKREPANPQFARAELLAALQPVDFVVIFDEPDPLAVIRALRPAVLAKGGDYASTDVVGAELVAEWGGRVEVTPYEPGFSTSTILGRGS